MSVRPNKVKIAGSRGRWFLLDILHPDFLEIFGLLGYDSFTIEGEHAACSDETILSLIRVAEAYDMTPMIRLRTLDRGEIGRLLDLGIQGIHYTCVESAEEVETLLRFTKYPPFGERSFSPDARCNRSIGDDYATAMKDSNDAVWLFLTIETVTGVDHVDEILGVPDIDLVGVGASDLAASMGQPGFYEHPDVQAVLLRLREAMAGFSHALPPGTRPFGNRPGVYTPASAYLIAHLLEDHLAESDRLQARVGPI